MNKKVGLMVAMGLLVSYPLLAKDGLANTENGSLALELQALE